LLISDFLSSNGRIFLQRHGLDNFANLWNLQLNPFDKPNIGRGGWSSVSRLDLDGQGFFVKRQINYYIRSLQHPLGESTVAYEFRNIRLFNELGLSSLDVVFCGERYIDNERRAILMTRDLENWTPLSDLLHSWPDHPTEQRLSVIYACAMLTGKLHASGFRHGGLYPKHLFLRHGGSNWQGCLIDLEKARHLWLCLFGRFKDLDAFLRKVPQWTPDEHEYFLKNYLQVSGSRVSLAQWQKQLNRRRADKETRR